LIGRLYSTKEIGDAGEEKAARFLEERGYRIVERNFRCKRGEVDIVASIYDTLVFAEVKTMPASAPEDIGLLIDGRKQRRIIGSAEVFLAMHHEYGGFHIRFDGLIVDMPGMPPVYHIEGAFEG
jgi:putative endonuclease